MQLLLGKLHRPNMSSLFVPEDFTDTPPKRVHAQCWQLLGQWLNEGGESRLTPLASAASPTRSDTAYAASFTVFEALERATTLDPQWSEGWAALAEAQSARTLPGADCTEQAREGHAAQAIWAHLQHLALLQDGVQRMTCDAQPTASTLQLVYQVLHLYFRFSASPKVDKVFASGRVVVGARMWLPAVSHFVARLDSSVPALQQMVLAMIRDVGQQCVSGGRSRAGRLPAHPPPLRAGTRTP